jgi:hypothetical protein
VTISLVDHVTELADSLPAQPMHATGDLMLCHAYRDGAAGAPTKPSGWVNLYTISAATGAYMVAYKYAQSSADTFGTWTNASHLTATVWRGAANTIVFPSYTSVGGTTNATMNWPAQPVGSFTEDAEDVALFAYGVNRNTTNNLAQTLGALTNLFDEGNGSTFQACGKYQLARSTIWASTSITLATSSLWRTLMLSLIEQSVYGAGGGSASFNPLDHLLVG